MMFDDGIKYMCEVVFELIDVVIVDGIDLVGLGEGLFNYVFYISCLIVFCFGGILI